MKSSTQNVTNITFIFETSPNTNPQEKKVGRTWHIMSLHLKKWGDTSPTKLYPYLTSLKVHVKSLEEMIQIHPNSENTI